MSEAGKLSPTSVNASPTSVFNSPTATSYTPTQATGPGFSESGTTSANPQKQPTLQNILTTNASQPFLRIDTGQGMIYAEHGRVVSQAQFQSDYQQAANQPYEERVAQVKEANAEQYIQTLDETQPSEISQLAEGTRAEEFASRGQSQFAPAPVSVPIQQTGPERTLELQSEQTTQSLEEQMGASELGPEFTSDFANARGVQGEYQQLLTEERILSFVPLNPNTASPEEIGLYNAQVNAFNANVNTYNANLQAQNTPKGPAQQAFSYLTQYIGYAGFALSLTPREAFSLLTTGKTITIPPPSIQESRAAGQAGLLSGIAVGTGFAAAPIEAAIIPESLGVGASIGARLGIQAGLGAAYGAGSSLVTGQNPLQATLEGAIIFPASGVVLGGAASSLSRITSYGADLLRSYVPNPGADIEEPYSLNFVQRLINENLIQPNIQPSSGFPAFGTFASTYDRAAAFAGQVSDKLGVSPYATSNADFIRALKASYESDTVETPPEEVSGGSGGRAGATQETVLIQAPETAQEEEIGLTQSAQESAQEAAYRIGISRGRLPETETTYFTTPPGFQFKGTGLQGFGLDFLQIVGASKSQATRELPSLGQGQTLQNITGLSQIQTPLSLQSQAQQSLQLQSQISLFQQVQALSELTVLKQETVTDEETDLDLEEVGVLGYVSPLETFSGLNTIVPGFDILERRRKRKVARKSFVDYRILNQLSPNIAASFGDVGAELASQGIFSLGSSDLLSFGKLSRSKR